MTQRSFLLISFDCLTADYSPFLGIEKGAVLQEARVFNDPQLDARRCSQVFLRTFYSVDLLF